jgi:hypothetical protein
MPKMLRAAMLLALMGTASAMTPARADAVTQVMDHHVANMKSGNTEGVLSDYAPDAVVVAPPALAGNGGVFVGKDTRKLFSVLTDKDHVPGNKTMKTRYDSVAPDTAIMHWVQFQGTAQEASGYDVFVVRGGKIVFQTVTVSPAARLMKAN